MTSTGMRSTDAMLRCVRRTVAGTDNFTLMNGRRVCADRSSLSTRAFGRRQQQPRFMRGVGVVYVCLYKKQLVFCCVLFASHKNVCTFSPYLDTTIQDFLSFYYVFVFLFVLCLFVHFVSSSKCYLYASFILYALNKVVLCCHPGDLSFLSSRGCLLPPYSSIVVFPFYTPHFSLPPALHDVRVHLQSAVQYAFFKKSSLHTKHIKTHTSSRYGSGFSFVVLHLRQLLLLLLMRPTVPFFERCICSSILPCVLVYLYLQEFHQAVC